MGMLRRLRGLLGARTGPTENSLRALAKKSSLQLGKKRRYSAARKSAIRVSRSEVLSDYARVADNSDLGFFTFADAASLRTCRIEFAASPRTSRLRTFNNMD